MSNGNTNNMPEENAAAQDAAGDLTVEDAVSLLNSMPANEKTVPTKEVPETYVLVNAYDELVRTNVRTLMSKMDMCQCEKCYLDACALVFNRQYTHFVTTRQGALLTKIPEMSHSNQVEMTVVILDALRMVKSFPKH